MTKIHHINCGTFCPHGSRLLLRRGGLLSQAEFCCHCLLIETPKQLVLVDTGIGTADIKNPAGLGMLFNRVLQPQFKLSDSAREQVKQLGYDVADVRHIIPTHLDLDHAGGLPDFPDAQVHVLGIERDMAVKPSLLNRGRFKAHHFAHNPHWQTYYTANTSWFGFEGVAPLLRLDIDVLLIPLPGHTMGHCAVAVEDQPGHWLLHVGDLYYSALELNDDAPPLMRGLSKMMAMDNKLRLANLQRIRALKNSHSDKVTIFSSHDPLEFKNIQFSS